MGNNGNHAGVDGRAQIRVLVADDHTVVRDGLRALLEAEPGMAVVGGAASGRQAVRMVEHLRPDVVIIDISMPEVDGIEAAGQIRAVAPEAGVIVLSMSGAPEHIFRALQMGVRGYLLKESAGREVIKAVRTVHAGEYYLSQPVTRTLVEDYLGQREAVEKRDPLELLSEREREVLRWVVQGKTSAEIAEILYLSPKTVESYRSRLMQKLDTPNLPSLMRFAVQAGLIS